VTGIVIDASVTLSWCFPDERTPMSMNVLDRLKAGERALVPAFWSLEVLNTLLVGERKGRITAEQTRAFFDTLRVLGPVLDYASLAQAAVGLSAGHSGSAAARSGKGPRRSLLMTSSGGAPTAVEDS
jgi:predicted nucleic acid-binding protein